MLVNTSLFFASTQASTGNNHPLTCKCQAIQVFHPLLMAQVHPVRKKWYRARLSFYNVIHTTHEKKQSLIIHIHFDEGLCKLPTFYLE